MIHELADDTLSPARALLRLLDLGRRAEKDGGVDPGLYAARRLLLAERALLGRAK
jgi:hypothetical protein